MDASQPFTPGIEKPLAGQKDPAKIAPTSAGKIALSSPRTRSKGKQISISLHHTPAEASQSHPVRKKVAKS